MNRLLLDDGSIDLDAGEVRRGAEVTPLSPIEVQLLRYLAARSPEPVSRVELLVDVWDYHPASKSRTVENTIRRLRKKIERDASDPHHLVTDVGSGYRFDAAQGTDEHAPLLGRRRALDELGWLLTKHRCITLIGPGGIGKTSLARAVPAAERVWVEAREARTGGELAQITAATLGVRTGSDPIGRVGTVLADRGGLLLVLDNLEQVEGAAEAVDPWLATAPELRIVVTSRRAIGAQGEHVWPVQPLDADAAAALFARRARESVTDYTVPADAPLTQLLDRLDRLPLAIELAAARVGVLGIEQMLERLDARFGLLRDQERALEGTIGWSWELLAPPARAALARLSVLHGRFTADAAEGVLGPDALDRLDELRRASLVRAHPGRVPEFDLLESIRAFAALRLAERDDAEDAHARHAAFHARWGRQQGRAARGPSGPEAHAALERARDDLWAAHAFLLPHQPERALDVATGLDVVLARRGPATTRARLWRETWEAQDGRARTEAAVFLADALRGVGQTERAVQLVDALTPDDPYLRGRVAVCRGGLAMERGAIDEAQTWLRQAIAELDADTPWALFLAHLNLGTSWWLSGRMDEAERHYLAALQVARDAGDPYMQGLGHGMLGGVHLQQGALDRAQVDFERAIEAHRATGNRVAEASALANVGTIALDRGQLDDAATTLDRAIALDRRQGDRRQRGVHTANRALCDLLAGRPLPAGQLLEEASVLLQADPRAAAYVDAWRAVSLADEGRAGAERLLDAAQGVLAELDDAVGLALVTLCRGLVHAAGADLAAARACLPAADAGRAASVDVRLAERALLARLAG